MPEGVAATTVAGNVSSVVGVFKYDVDWSFVACRSNAVTLTVTEQRKYTSSKLHYIYVLTEHSFCIASLASAVLHHCYQANVSTFHSAGDITPPIVRVYGLSTSSHMPHPTTAAITYLNI